MSFELRNLTEVIEEVKKSCKGKGFKQSIELIVNLRDLDLRRPENRIIGLLELPHPPNKPVKVCVFASGELYTKAKKLGVDLILARDDLERIAKDKRQAKKIAKNHDFFVAEASLMPLIGRTWGVYLGPRGKMPTPVPPTADIESILERLRRTVRIRVRNQPVVQLRVGTEDMDSKLIAENVNAALNWIIDRLPKGLTNIKDVYLKGTMTPSFRVELRRR
ncbi:MAG: 50S ribosomal protein L1 [Candidatus Bathyarchaeota archaeon B24]|nr:MAG: 50S ribosomal protein L1 [Candidatus Bathyarchaeota archaeon B24]RLI26741.1 MAG: 50S ribosomal protein L1 [Candidatus Bathyarchaeota archaeon]